MYRKIGILCAGDSELAPFLPHLEHARTSEKALLKFYEGTLCGLPAVSTAVAYHDVADDILTDFHPWLESIWFPADPALRACAEAAAAKQPREYPVRFGRMVTGEAFITDDGRQEINARFAPLTVDMESAAVAHVCHANGVPFLAIRTVTDTADHSGAGNFELNCEKASAIAKDFTLALLREIQNA